MYRVIFSQNAEKQFKKLDKQLQIRIISSLTRISVNPSNHIERLVGFPYFKLRVGDYKIIIDLKISESIIFLIKIGHRKDIYDKL